MLFEEIEVFAEGAKKCPMCGSDRIKVENKAFFTRQDFRSLAIICDHCGLTIRKGNSKDYLKAYEEVLEAWNRRAS